MIGTDVVDEDAFHSTGIEYETTNLGFWKLEPALTYVREQRENKLADSY
jgi:hypothetical protein